MPAERRSLRSNSKSDANGEKARSNSQSSSSNKDKPAPARAAANKAKSAPPKKGSSAKSANSNMGGHDKPHTNGSDPVENGVNGTEDVDMEEDTAGGPTSSIKSNRDRDGDEKMTVVVPPSKGPRLSGEPGQDKEDVAMEGVEDVDADKGESDVDPKAKAVQGTRRRALPLTPVLDLTFCFP